MEPGLDTTAVTVDVVVVVVVEAPGRDLGPRRRTRVLTGRREDYR